MVKTLLNLSLGLVLLVTTACFGNEKDAAEKAPAPISNKLNVRIKTIHGDIVFKLQPDIAPITVSRFQELTQEGFYNGLTFHRVIPGFVAQGGDPSGTGAGGSGKKLKAEFSDRKHVKGTIAMARAQDINSADSQFYITLGEQPHLDGKYTIFGQVIEGIDVVDKIRKGDKMLSVSLE